MTNKLDFFVIGAAKAGTTALHQYCVKHPDVGTGKLKEIHFFDHFNFFEKLPVNYEPLHNVFDFSTNKKTYGDFTPDYIYFEESARLIWEYNPKAKIIAILRNPIHRAFSQWNMNISLQRDSIPFSQAIREERLRSRAYLPNWHGHYSYIDRGFYTEQIRRFQHFFPNNQLLIFKYDDFKKEQEKHLNRFFEFIGVAPEKYIHEALVANRYEYDSLLNKEDHHYLLTLFRNDILNLQQLLNWDCSDWLTEPTNY